MADKGSAHFSDELLTQMVKVSPESEKLRNLIDSDAGYIAVEGLEDLVGAVV
jgi:hypothetical protein